VSQKTSHVTQDYNSIRRLPILKILSPLESILNYQQNLYNISHRTLILSLYYLENLKYKMFWGITFMGHSVILNIE